MTFPPDQRSKSNRVDTCAAANKLRENPLYNAVIASPEFRRLSDVSFLGILGHNRSPFQGVQSSRYEHSLAVGALSLEFTRQRGFSEAAGRYMVLAGLLHDVGHPCFSHSLEPVFADRFGLDHHSVTKQLILTSASLQAIWREYDICPEQIIETLDGNTSPESVLIAKNAINFDTLDGIARTEAHFGSCGSVTETSRQVFEVLCSGADLEQHTKLFDSFWEHKCCLPN